LLLAAAPLLAVAAAILLIPELAHAERANVAPDGATGEGETGGLGLSGRVMTGFESVLTKPTVAQGGPRTDEYGLFVKQARLELSGELADRFSLELSADLSDGLTPKVSAFDINRPQYLRDAFLQARFSRAVRLRVGHFKRPFSRLATTSAADLPIRSRGLLDAELVEDGRWGDRALGAMLWGRLRRPKLDWYLGVWNPTWLPTTHQNGYDLMGRVVYEPWKWLSIGANGGRKSVDLGTRQASGHAAGGDVRLRFLDATVQFEGSYGELVFEPDAPAAFGAHALVSYDFELTPLAVLQPVAFVEYADAHSVFLESEAVRFVGGLNVVHHDVFRVMPQVGITRPVGDASEYNPWAEQYEYYLMFTLDL
jgi:hypothetical protein